MRTPLAAVLFPVVVVGQQAVDPLSFVPDDAIAFVRVACGERWARELGATRLGKALADPAMHDAWAGVAAAIREHAPPALQRVLDAAPRIAAGYGGDVVAAIRFDWPSLLAAIASGDVPEFAVLLAFGPDGRTEPAELARRIDELLPRGDVPLQRLAGQDVPVHTVANGEVTRPFVRDGSVVVLAGNRLAAHADRFLGENRRAFAVPAAVRGALAGGMVALPERGLDDLLAAALTHTAIGDGAAALRVLRLDALRRLGFVLRGDGEHVDQHTWLELDGADRGVFDVVFPVRDRAPALLRLLPAGCRTFSVGCADVQRLWAIVCELWDALGDHVPAREQLLAQFAAATKVRFDEDLVALIGDELLQLPDLDAITSDEEPEEHEDRTIQRARDRFGDTCYVLALRDGARFGANLETALRSRGLHAARKTERYAGTELHRLTLLGAIQLEYAVTDTFLVVGVGGGDGTARLVRGVLDTAKAAAGGTPGELPADVAALVATLPSGWSKLEVASLLEIVQQLATAMEQLDAVMRDADLSIDDAGSGFALLARFVGPLRQAMRRHGADLAVTTTVSTKDRVTMRTRM